MIHAPPTQLMPVPHTRSSAAMLGLASVSTQILPHNCWSGSAAAGPHWKQRPAPADASETHLPRSGPDGSWRQKAAQSALAASVISVDWPFLATIDPAATPTRPRRSCLRLVVVAICRVCPSNLSRPPSISTFQPTTYGDQNPRQMILDANWPFSVAALSPRRLSPAHRLPTKAARKRVPCRRLSISRSSLEVYSPCPECPARRWIDLTEGEWLAWGDDPESAQAPGSWSLSPESSRRMRRRQRPMSWRRWSISAS